MAKLLYALIFLGMGINGSLYLGWFLSPPNPDRIGYWFLIYFFVFPFLGILGLIAVWRRDELNIPIDVGATVLTYVSILVIVLNSYQLGLSWVLNALPQGSYEWLHVLLFTAAIGRLFLLWKR